MGSGGMARFPIPTPHSPFPIPFLRLRLSFNYEPGYRVQYRRVAMRSSRRADGFAAEAMGHLSGAVDSVERGVSGLLARGVLAGGLAQLFASGDFVEQVVCDLKSQAGLLS